MTEYKEYQVSQQSELCCWSNEIGSYDTLQEALSAAREVTTHDWLNWPGEVQS